MVTWPPDSPFTTNDKDSCTSCTWKFKLAARSRPRSWAISSPPSTTHQVDHWSGCPASGGSPPQSTHTSHRVMGQRQDEVESQQIHAMGNVWQSESATHGTISHFQNSEHGSHRRQPSCSLCNSYLQEDDVGQRGKRRSIVRDIQSMLNITPGAGETLVGRLHYCGVHLVRLDATAFLPECDP
jgi:hypothetical protein